MTIAVAGPATCAADIREFARELGRRVADERWALVTGGRGGVMEAASQGAREAGGLVVALLPGTDRTAANEWAEVVLPTGLGNARNALVATAGDVLVAFLDQGGPGTVSEVALAVKSGVPVVVAGELSPPPPLRAVVAATPAAVVAAVRALLG